MSAESASGQEGFGLFRAIGKLRGDPKTSMRDMARAAQRAARQKAECELVEARHQIQTRTIVRQDALEAWPMPGLAPMTRVRTSFGDVPSAALRKGDEVLTQTGQYRRIAWLNRVHLDEHILASKEDCNPIVIAARALEGRLPSSEIMLSPRQIIVADAGNGLKSDREAAMLLSRPGVRRLRETSISYTMFHVGEPAAICVEGLFLSFPIEHRMPASTNS